MATMHEEVRERYARAAGGACCGETNELTDCCGSASAHESEVCCGDQAATGSACCTGAASTAFGYTIEELGSLPEGADLALGCGNPTALASLTEGERVLDLGSGGGIDCLLAASRVGPTGSVIGVDMTPQMIELARRNSRKAGATNVEFRLGEIEHLPAADSSVDVIISNCVVNLAPDKRAVLAEAFRVLAPGGRLSVSDLVLGSPLEDSLRENLVLLTGCIAGALLRDEFLELLRETGFEDVEVARTSEYLRQDHLGGLTREARIGEDDAARIAERVRSVTVVARKPA